MKMTEMERYEADLIALFQEAKKVLEQAKDRLQDLYSENHLEWSEDVMRSLKGDIYAKVLGKYLESKTEKKAQYEKTIVKGKRWAKADILLNGVAIESKAMGILRYSRDYLKTLKRNTVSDLSRIGYTRN